MATKSPSQNTTLGIKLPAILSIKDLITVISVAISMTLAWGVFTTRITVLEKEVVQLQQETEKLSGTVEKMKEEQHRIDSIQRQNSVLIDQLFVLARKPIPNRN